MKTVTIRGEGARRSRVTPLLPSAKPELWLTCDVRVGDRLLHHDVVSGITRAARVTRVDADVRREKRAFFLPSPHVLVNDIVASPYMGAHPSIAAWQHAVFDVVRRGSPHTTLTQAFVTATAAPFILLNTAAQHAFDLLPALVPFVSE